MKIYDHELSAGITNLVGITKADCDIVDNCQYDGEFTESLAKVIANYAPSNPNQRDLYYINCILASVGWNKNDDVFDKLEFWSAKASPEDKPFNYMHDETDIIGHMTGAVVLDRSGNQISKDTNFEDLPDELDIAVSAVIYKAWSDVEQLARVNEFIEGIDKKEWAVSMECLFRSFDYAVISPEGEHKVIARNEESSFLTKHLRAYGGTGEFEGFKIGRLLKNISFSGIGLVKRPANPRSLILNVNINNLGDFKMADSVSKTAAEEVNENLTEKVTELENKLTASNEEISNLKTSKAEELKAKDEKITELETELTSVKAENVTLSAKLTEAENKARSVERKSVLASMKLDEEVIAEMIEKFKDLDDNAFSVAVSLAKSVKPEPVATETEDTSTASDETEEVEEEEVEASEVEEVEEQSLNDAGDDVQEDQRKVRAGLQDWFAKSVFKTTKNLNK